MATTKYKKQTKFATTPVVQGHIQSWDWEVIQCRSWRHAWDPFTALEAPSGLGAEIQRCSRCGAIRHRVIEVKTGKIVTGWTPRLPKGYQMKSGSGRIAGHTFDMVRVAAFQSTSARTVKSTELYAELERIVKQGE